MKRRVRTYSGSLSPAVTPAETAHRALARRAAAEGIVLMKNEGLLPLRKDVRVALYGSGAMHIVKGGWGSGDVNEREVVSILQGLRDAGICLVNDGQVEDAIRGYDAARIRWRDEVLEQLGGTLIDSGMEYFNVTASTPVHVPELTIHPEDVQTADVVIYVISRASGEGTDRHNVAGDYQLTDTEIRELELLAGLHARVAVLLNTGGQIELKEILANPAVLAILNISQGGMEAGHAAADVLTGAVNPSGRLTSTWALDYSDFPSADTFGHISGDLSTTYYREGIYVGYRYFESFGREVAFPFGHGLSYTTFELSEARIHLPMAGKQVSAAMLPTMTGEGAAAADTACGSATHSLSDHRKIVGDTFSVSVTVTNTGSVSGREVVQIYAACPQGELKKEYRRLAGFAKTGLLAPGEQETLIISIPAKALASFHEDSAQWRLDAGEYGIFAGPSSDRTRIVGILSLERGICLEQVRHIQPLQKELTEMERPDTVVDALTASWKKEAAGKGLVPIPFLPVADGFISREEAATLLSRHLTPDQQREICRRADDIAARLTDEEITALLMGEITKGQDNLVDDRLVETGIFVPGAAGETTCMLEEKYDVPGISMADGPAGLRLMRNYDVDRATGKIYGIGLFAAMEGGLFATPHHRENVDTYYQYAAAIPIGTLLAQSFDTALVEEVGHLVAEEMLEFGVAWWLAPGLNIHRNPLCGRNFEYYSEDPLVAGCMVAAMTRGVQSIPGVGTTIKHFACNNQEDNRMHCDSVVSERALREIYLTGFEIAVKTAQPMCIMTSYNRLNGIYTSNSYDLCTIAAREEWGFDGIIMTDWTTTTSGGSCAHACALAGNDLIMPGNPRDVEDIMTALKDGRLPRETARQCCRRLLRILFSTIGMEWE